MKTLNDYFDEIYCINLNKRTDRWEECQKEFNKHNINVNRFNAFNGEDFSNEVIPNLNASQIGCLMSHRELIKKIKSKNLKNALILEDDIQFSDDLNEKLPEIMKQLPSDWDMLYLGGNHIGNNPWSIGTLSRVKKNIFRVTHCLTLHAYAIRENIYDKIIESLHGTTADEAIAKIQNEINCYIVRPHIAWQRASYSDNRGFFIDAPFLQKDEEFFQGRIFGPQMLNRNDVRDKMTDWEKQMYDNQKNTLQ